jgi:hypothetical protein
MIKVARIEIGTGGLPFCRACGGGDRLHAEPAAEIVSATERACGRWGECPGPNIELSGGEAFGHPELPALISSAVDEGAERVLLWTSGAALTDLANAQGVLRAGVTGLVITAVGGPSSADEITGIEGSWAATAAGIAQVSSAASSLALPLVLLGRVPVCRHNLEHAADAVGGLAASGAVAVTLELSPEAAASVHAAEFVASAVETGIVNACWVSVTGADTSRFGLDALHERAPVEVIA